MYSFCFVIGILFFGTLNTYDGEKVLTDKKLSIATFAVGCFWCMEKPYDELEGVYSTISGYTGGHKKNPTYEEVSSGSTGHTEAVQITYDPEKVSYEKLLEVFWINIDPTVKNRQFCDVGAQYRSAIFFHDEEQERLAKQSKIELPKVSNAREPATPPSSASTPTPGPELVT
ncbi:peptide-methionine (S)-S-oxide reductase MsrA, partial [candidate division KSB1 bacterium]|nr:peptide-methionine (S)-S-oxide reductase MsrA [candidate division KSB1 bacterium]